MKQTIWMCVTSIIIALIIMLMTMHIEQSHDQAFANDKQADFVTTQLAQKTSWMQNINNAITNVRNTNLSIRQQCESGKTPSQSQQNILRSQARTKFLYATAGAGAIFDSNTINDIRAFFQYDKSVSDVCAGAPTGDDKWFDLAKKVSEDMTKSIDADKAEIAHLHGVSAS